VRLAALTPGILLAAVLAVPTGAEAQAAAGEVSEVRVTDGGGHTAVTVVTRGPVRVRDFMLEDPPRLIVDVEGARHALPGHVFDEVERGGIRRLRTSQFREDVVRLVFDLAAPHPYRVEREGDQVRLHLEDTGGSFRRWSTAGRRAAGSSTPSPSSSSPSTSTSSTEPGRPLASAGPRDGTDAGRTVPVPVRAVGALPVRGRPTLVQLAGDRRRRAVVVAEVVADAQTPDVALDAILQAQGLGWRRVEGGILLVDELGDLRGRDTLRTETRVLRINYAGADSVASVLRELASDRGQVVPYRGTNSIIVTDAPPVVSRMDSLVRVLDRRTPQVSIEAKIVFVDRTNVRGLGIGYNLRDDDGSASAISGELDEGRTSADGEGTDGTDGNGDGAPRVALFAFLDALATRELTDVEAAPTIQVVDNERARIQVGDDVPIRVLERGAQAEQAQATVRFEPTGVILEVTPHVTNNNQVLLDIRAERSGVSLGQPDVGFTVNRQLGETRVLVDDGETAVIGGLTRSELTESVSGIPGLMNLPLVGGLFRTSRRQELEEDLIILVTPHVSSPAEEAPPASS